MVLNKRALTCQHVRARAYSWSYPGPEAGKTVCLDCKAVLSPARLVGQVPRAEWSHPIRIALVLAATLAAGVLLFRGCQPDRADPSRSLDIMQRSGG